MNFRKRIAPILLASVMAFSTIGTPVTVGAEETLNVHEHTYKKTTIGATCEKNGYFEYVCSECGDSYTEDNPADPAKGHSYYATDNGNGQHTMVCRNDASHTYSEPHEWVFQNKVLPTCGDEGYTLYVCGKCGREEKREYVESLNHDYSWIDNENGSHTGICSRNKNHVVTEYCKEYYHDYVTKPTCLEKGYTSHICDKCGYVLVDSYVDPVGHEYKYSNNGNGTHTGVCKHDSTHVITEEHDFEETVVDPTCTTRGYTKLTCKDCGYTYNDNYVPATTHKYVYTSNDNGTHTGICEFNSAHSIIENCEYTVKTVKPTCENQGYDLHTCKVCGYSYKDNFVAKLGHDYVWVYNDNGTHTGTCRNDSSEVITQPCDTVDKVVAPTCTEDGYTEHKCSICKAVYRDNYVAKLGHDYVYTSLNDGTHQGVCKHNKRHTVREACDYEDIITKPTCTTNGYTTHRCKACGYTYVDSKTPMLGHNHIYEDLGDGTHRVTCKNDPYEINIIEPHKYTVTTVSPTCETKGYDLHTCKLCGNEYKDNYKDATGHNYIYKSNNNATHTGTCTKDPSHKIILTHENIDVVTEPTCTTGGYTTHTCKVCGNIYVDSQKPAKGHDWSDVVTAPTCTTEGYTTHTCKACGYVLVDSKVPATGHAWADVVTAPTCTNDGFTTRTCKNCGKVIVDNVVKATGHKFKWVTDKEPEYGVPGSKHEECTECGNKKAAVAIKAKIPTAKLLPVIKKSTKNSQTITWNRIPDAKYYKVYGSDCGDSYLYLGSVKGTSLTRKGLKSKKYYKYYVEAVNTDNSSEVTLAKSISIHATTTGGKKKNPTKLKASLKNKTIKLGKTGTIKASVKDKNVSRHVKRLRYISSNTKVATVNAKGKVTAKGKGTCYIYVMSQTGAYKTIKVTIK